MLDLDDVGPEVGEHHRAVRAGEHPGQVDDADAGERELAGIGGGRAAQRQSRLPRP
jgi:hypothetical protein